MEEAYDSADEMAALTCERTLGSAVERREDSSARADEAADSAEATKPEASAVMLEKAEPAAPVRVVRSASDEAAELTSPVAWAMAEETWLPIEAAMSSVVLWAEA